MTPKNDTMTKVALDAITILSSLGYSQYSNPLLSRLEALFNERK